MPDNGKYALGGFKGKGRGRLPKQRPSQNTQGCCSYQEAGRAIIRRNYKLAARYVRMDVKARLGII